MLGNSILFCFFSLVFTVRDWMIAATLLSMHVNATQIISEYCYVKFSVLSDRAVNMASL